VRARKCPPRNCEIAAYYPDVDLWCPVSRRPGALPASELFTNRARRDTAGLLMPAVVLAGLITNLTIWGHRMLRPGNRLNIVYLVV
jgi:hypothetical protein